MTLKSTFLSHCCSLQEGRQSNLMSSDAILSLSDQTKRIGPPSRLVMDDRSD